MTDRTRTPAPRRYPTDCADHYIAGYKAGARAPLDVERLARALTATYVESHETSDPDDDDRRDAAIIAREYAKEPQP